MTKKTKKAPAPKAKAGKAAAAGTVSVTVRVGPDGPEPILGAAYLMTDRAWARVDGDRKKSLTVTLKPRSGGAKALAALEADFAAELETERLRWAVARNNAPVRLHIAQQAVLLAQGRLPEAPAAAPAPAPAETLTAEQQAEIDRLIAEVETEIKELKTKKLDPENVAATWEETHREEGS